MKRSNTTNNITFYVIHKKSVYGVVKKNSLIKYFIHIHILVSLKVLTLRDVSLSVCLKKIVLNLTYKYFTVKLF